MPWGLLEEASTAVQLLFMQFLNVSATALLIVWSLLSAIPSILLESTLHLDFMAILSLVLAFTIEEGKGSFGKDK